MTHDWRNAMIEEASKTIREVRTVTFRGEDGYLSVGSADDETLARAALAVFEKAHTPTGDERGALARELFMADASDKLEIEECLPLADRVYALGFRRSEVSEPSAASLLHIANRIGASERSSADFDIATSRPLGPEPQGEPSDASTCDHCGGEAWHHTVECFTGAKPLQEAISRLENCLSNRDAGIGAWSMVQPEDVRTVLSALRAAGSSR